MTWWMILLRKAGIIYTFAFRPSYGTDLDAIRHALHQAGLHLFLLGDAGDHGKLVCLRRHTYHVALILAAMNCAFSPPPPNVARRPPRHWGASALQPFHLPRDTVNMLLDAYTSPAP